jgi:hypothetical protein
VDAIALLRQQFQITHNFLEGTMADLTEEQAHWSPPGAAMPIAAVYAHVVTSEDAIINGLVQQVVPLSSGNWAGRTGLSEGPPMGPPWAEWAGRVRVDLAAVREYAQAVYANTDAYLANLTEEDLDEPLDLSALGLGQQTVGSLMGLLIWNAGAHCGEISSVKGLQGLKGYPV